MKGVTINAIGLEQNDAVKEHSSFLIELTKDVFRDLNEGHQTEYTAQQIQMKQYFAGCGGEIIKKYV